MKHLVRLASITVAVALVSAFGADFGASSALGSASLSTAAPRTATADLSSALGSDGTFHGAPGVSGRVDPKVWTLVSDPAAGEAPRFAPTADSVRTSIAGPWSALGSNGSGNGALNGWVNAMAVSGTDVYVGGYITDVGGIPGANFIAKWDGSVWSAVGAPYDIYGQVNAIAVSGTDVYISGDFTDVAGIPEADYIAKWNGSTWSALGSNGSGDGALNSEVQALATSNDGGDLYVGGWFTDAAGIATADYVAQWNGGAWMALGGDGSGDGAIATLPGTVVFALAVSGTDIYVGGGFNDVAGIAEADHIAKFDGINAWSNLGSDFGNDGAILGPAAVYALALSGTDLYVGGSFHDVNSLSADNVAKWDTQNVDGLGWSPLGSNAGDGAITHNVHALAVVGTDLYVGGEFYDAAGIATADRIARWDGATWNAMGPDGGALNSEVDALTASPSSVGLYVGGMFDNAAGIGTADYIALWGYPSAVVKPDAQINVSSGSYVGNDIYNTDASGQSKSKKIAAGKSATFGVKIQNDGTVDDASYVQASCQGAGFKVTYMHDSTDVTASVVADSYFTGPLAPGAEWDLVLKIKAKSTLASGKKMDCLVLASSFGPHNENYDSVKATAVVR